MGRGNFFRIEKASPTLTGVIWKKAKIVQRVQVEPDRKGWGRLMDLYKEHDENRIKVAKEDIDSLLVFVRRV